MILLITGYFISGYFISGFFCSSLFCPANYENSPFGATARRNTFDEEDDEGDDDECDSGFPRFDFDISRRVRSIEGGVVLCALTAEVYRVEQKKWS